ncbi:MAG: hypothetical protein WCK03_04255, partial [Candidatus Taylorbacteria bacterium]
TYVAIITLTPKTGYTLQGIWFNEFTVAGVTTVTNGYNSGVITATFPAEPSMNWPLMLNYIGSSGASGHVTGSVSGYGPGPSFTSSCSSGGALCNSGKVLVNSYDAVSILLLIATPDAGSTFSGWVRGSSQCLSIMDAGVFGDKRGCLIVIQPGAYLPNPYVLDVIFTK